MLEALFGNDRIEKILFYIMAYTDCYAKGVATLYDIPLNGVQQQLQRLENRGADAGAQGWAGRGGGYRSGIPGGGGGGAGEQEPGGLLTQRCHAAGGCRRRGRQRASARTAYARGGNARNQRVLSPAGVLHRQRRDDRLRRGAATGDAYEDI